MDRGKPCYLLFTREHYKEMQDQCMEKTKELLDNVILGHIEAHDEVVGSRSKHALTPRQRSNMHFYHHGLRICRATFLELHGIGKLMYNSNV